MDLLVLLRVVPALDAALAGARLESYREESATRTRLVFVNGTDGRPRSVAVSLRPELPWIGRPARRHDGAPWSPSPFGGACRRELEGLVLESARLVGRDRVVALQFGGGVRLIAELATHGANLVLLHADGTVAASAHQPKRSAERVRPGARWSPPSLPPGTASPFGMAASEIDARFEALVAAGEPPLEALRRHWFGIGTAGATLVLQESAAAGETPGRVLERRLRGLEEGSLDPVIEGDEDPLEAAERGPLDPSRFRLLPWSPEGAGPAASTRRDDPAATAGLWHEAVERGLALAARVESLRAILRAERRRAWDAEHRAQEDLAGFEDPDLWRRRGEALLAGLREARRCDGVVTVPDPYDAAGGEITFPAPAGVSLPAVAEDCFRRHRRARRGLEGARGRLESLARRRARLEEIGESVASDAAAEERRLTQSLSEIGVAVGLRAGTRVQRAARSAALPRVEGVRLATSTDGWTFLVGRTGRDNDRLTFKVAGPDDFWLHALGVPGAHVVIRNPDRASRPPRATLEEAAAAAAWFSDARGHGAVDVTWTRRKHVRRARGQPPGTVVVKRSEVVRVRPAAPGALE
ncbi:MAG TPA: NFACT RNA binding domain-containing protein [Candidatus Polarisedimenticolaceae bacterium]